MRTKLAEAAVVVGLLLSSVSGVLYWRDTHTVILTDRESGMMITDLTEPTALNKETVQRISFAAAKKSEILALPKGVLDQLSDEQVREIFEALVESLELRKVLGDLKHLQDLEIFDKIKYLHKRYLATAPRARL